MVKPCLPNTSARSPISSEYLSVTRSSLLPAQEMVEGVEVDGEALPAQHLCQVPKHIQALVSDQVQSVTCPGDGWGTGGRWWSPGLTAPLPGPPSHPGSGQRPRLPVQEMVEGVKVDGEALPAQHLCQIPHLIQTLVSDQVHLCVSW